MLIEFNSKEIDFLLKSLEAANEKNERTNINKPTRRSQDLIEHEIHVSNYNNIKERLKSIINDGRKRDTEEIILEFEEDNCRGCISSGGSIEIEVFEGFRDSMIANISPQKSMQIYNSLKKTFE